MTLLPRAAALALCLAVAACAHGPTYSDAAAGLPPRPEGQGRVYFYRTSLLGAAVQPPIRLNRQVIGACEPNGVFFVDEPPGDYEATVATEVERRLTFTLAAGEDKYVRCYVSFGVLVGRGNLELVDPANGAREIQGLAYTGVAAPGR